MKKYLHHIKTVSALGRETSNVEAYSNPSHFLQAVDDQHWGGKVALADPIFEEKYWSKSDRTTQWLIQLCREMDLPPINGILMASSRGATELWEQQHRQFSAIQDVDTLCSPLTTLGNIASSVAQDLQLAVPSISFSNACSSFAQAIVQGAVWLDAEKADHMLIGAAEFALTPFTLAQIDRLKLSPPHSSTSDFPCQSLNPDKSGNGLVLGEAAVTCVLSTTPSSVSIGGLGYGLEKLTNPTGITPEGEGFQKAMKTALAEGGISKPDVILAHAPGTVRGDDAEMTACTSLWSSASLPWVISNKWKIGHSYGASAGLSLSLAQTMLDHQLFPQVPFEMGTAPEEINSVLINAMGFGGNVTSILLQREI